MRRLAWLCLQTFCFCWSGWAQIVCPPEANDSIQRCVLPVKEFAEGLGMTVRDAALGGTVNRLMPPAHAVDMFHELCNVIARFDFCVREAKNMCPRHIVINLIDVSYGYLCNEGYEPFMDNANCLMQLDQDPKIRDCHEKTMKSIMITNQDNNTNTDQKMKRTCRSLNYFAGCIESLVRSKCGVKAWAVIVRVLKDTTTTLMANCEFTVQVPDVLGKSTDVDNRIDNRPNNSNRYNNRHNQSDNSNKPWATNQNNLPQNEAPPIDGNNNNAWKSEGKNNNNNNNDGKINGASSRVAYCTLKWSKPVNLIIMTSSILLLSIYRL